MDEGGTATGLDSSARQCGTLDPTFGPEEQEMREEKQSLGRLQEKQGPWVQGVAGGGTLRKGTEARETLTGVEGLVKGGQGRSGSGSGTEAHSDQGQRGLTDGQESETYSVGDNRSSQGCGVWISSVLLGLVTTILLVWGPG